MSKQALRGNKEGPAQNDAAKHQNPACRNASGYHSQLLSAESTHSLRGPFRPRNDTFRRAIRSPHDDLPGIKRRRASFTLTREAFLCRGQDLVEGR